MMIKQICADVYRPGAADDVRRLLESEEELINKRGWGGRKFKSFGVYVSVGDALEGLRDFNMCGGFQKGRAVRLGNHLAEALNAWEAEENGGRSDVL